MNFLRSVPLCLCGLFSFSACSSGPQAGASAAKAYVDQGREAEKRGDHQGAVALYSRAIEADPKYADAWAERGYSNVKLRLHPESPAHALEYEDQALADYSEALRIDPARADAYYNRAMILTKRALFRQAAEDLLNAIKFKPQDPEPHLDIARIYETKFEDMGMKAGEHYEKYADLGGRDPDAREKAKQFKAFKKAIEGPAPGKPTTEEDEKKAQELHARAMALIREDKRDEAVKVLEELLTVYGRTRYVQEPQRQAGLKAMLNAFKKDKEPPK